MLPEGRQIIWGSFNVSDIHEEMVDEVYFNYVCFTQRQMRYKNRRGLDPQVKIFLDQEHIEISPEWNLPVPNEQAAYKSLAKYGKVEIRLEPEYIKKMNKAWEWTERQFMPYMGNSRVLSLEEAVQRLDMTTSSGFPFNREFPIKRELFEHDEYIMEWLEDDWQRLADDPFWTAICSSSLKEELRPQEKILENSQRTFTAFATDATVHGNRLFVDQNEKMYAAHTVTASSIGMSPLKGNWDKLYRKLNVFKNGYAMDESQFDSSQRKFLIWGCAQLRWKMYAPEFRTPDNFRRIKTYYRNVINSLILTPEGIMVMKKLGMPSGCPNTVTDNTLILYTMMAYAWICNCPEDDCSYEMFEEHTAKALVGDDNTWTVSDYSHQYYNAKTVIDSWKTLGIITTTDSMEPREAADLDFLSAHTVFVKGIAVPLYSRDKLMTSLLFAPQSHITPATSLQRCTNLLQIGWTDIVFRNFCRAFIAWLLSEYDSVLRDDPRWIVAKSSIMSDEAYFTLFTQRKAYFLQPQSYQETQERLIKLDNEEKHYTMPSRGKIVKTTTTQTKKANPGRGPKGKSQKVVTKTIVAGGARNGRRRGRGGRKLLGERRGKVQGRGATSFGSNRTRSIRVANEEYIGPVAAANHPNFNNTAYALNPGIAATFPWLSKQATQWEKYEFEYLEFYFKREVSEYASLGQQGKIIMSVDFNAADAPPNSKQQMEDSYPHRDGMPCENISLVIPKMQMKSKESLGRFVRVGGLPGNADIKTFDLGNLNVATQGTTADGEIGELRVKYVCKFSVPVLEPTNSTPQNNQLDNWVSSGSEPLANGIPATLVFATHRLNGGISTNSGFGVFTMPPGTYVVDWNCTFSATTNLTNVTTVVKIGGTAVPGAGATYIVLASAGVQAIDQGGSTTFQSDGVTQLRVDTTVTGSGTLTATGGIRFLLV